MLDSESLSSVDEEVGASQYEEETLEFRKTLFSKANTNIKNAQDRQKRDYDRKHHHQMVSLFSNLAS